MKKQPSRFVIAASNPHSEKTMCVKLRIPQRLQNWFRERALSKRLDGSSPGVTATIVEALESLKAADFVNDQLTKKALLSAIDRARPKAKAK